MTQRSAALVNCTLTVHQTHCADTPCPGGRHDGQPRLRGGRTALDLGLSQGLLGEHQTGADERQAEDA